MLGTLLLSGAAVVAGTAVQGAFHRNSPVFGRALGRLSRRERKIALTFDDGPNPETTPEILELLRHERVPATFFMLGRHVERWPDIAREVVADGHAVGNHGYHHRKLHFRGPGYIRVDLALGTDAIVTATGVTPTLFRAPHGFRNPWVSGIARELGQRTVGWTVGVWDSDKPGSAAIAERCVQQARPGAIILLHDGDGYDPEGDRTQTADALPTIIRELRRRGYEFTRLPA